MRKTQKAGSFTNNGGKARKGRAEKRKNNIDIKGNIAAAIANTNNKVSRTGQYPPNQPSNTTRSRDVAAASEFEEEVILPKVNIPEGEAESRNGIEIEQILQFKKIILEAFMKRVKPKVGPSYRPQQFNMNKIMHGITDNNLFKIMNKICQFKKPTSMMNRAAAFSTNKISAAKKKLRGNVACAAGGVCSDISLYFKCDVEMLNKIIESARIVYIHRVLRKRTNGEINHIALENIISQSFNYIFNSERQEISKELTKRISELHEYTRKPKAKGLSKRRKKKGKKTLKN
jgi:hypothetical protein